MAIVAGSLNVLSTLAIVLYVYVPAGPTGITALLLNVGMLAVLLIVFGVVAIGGGICALRRRAWGFALAGSICAVFSPGTLLGIAATVLVAVSRGEFGRTPTAS